MLEAQGEDEHCSPSAPITGCRVAPLVALIGLLNESCVYLLHRGTSQRTVDVATATTKHARRLLGAEHPDTLTARANLAVSYWQAGRTSGAFALAALAALALGAVVEAARELREQGTYGYSKLAPAGSSAARAAFEDRS